MLGGGRWGGDERLCLGTGASRDWTLSSEVSCRADPRTDQECSRLISCKGAVDPRKEKQMSLQEDTDGSLGICFLCALV